MNNVLDDETPQLVVINGDLITGENTFLENSTLYVDEVVAPLVERGLLWASTYGNHDSDFNLSRSGIFEREKRYPNSLTENMVAGIDAGVSNYYLPIYSADKTKEEPIFLLWFFDSRGGNYFQELDSNGNFVTQPSWVDVSVRQEIHCLRPGSGANILRLSTGSQRSELISRQNGESSLPLPLSTSPSKQWRLSRPRTTARG